MANIEELMPLTLAKGSTMRLFIDHAKDPTDPDHNWVEVTYDGEEDSEVFSVPPHWHDNHDEIMEVLYGRVVYTLDGKEITLSAGDAPLFIPRGSVHSIHAIKGEKAIATEKAVPAGEFKSLFFQDLFQTGQPSFLMAMRVFYDSHGYPSLPGNLKFLDVLFVTVFGFIAKAFVPPKLTKLKRKGEEGKSS